jgi:hypothetical protein
MECMWKYDLLAKEVEWCIFVFFLYNNVSSLLVGQE